MKLGIIGAMDVEVQTILQNCVSLREYEIGHFKIYTGKIGNQEVVVMKCGIGKVNAAIGTQIMLDRFAVDAVLNTGIAGGIHPDLKVGDMVVSSKVAHHDVNVTNFGYKQGQLPQLPLWFEADRALIHLVQKVKSLRLGPIVSGDQFICENEVKKSLWERFEPLCAEMEGASIAQTCYLNKVPFVIVRAISDQADAQGSIIYEQFEEQAAKECAELVLEIASQLGGQNVLQ
ncbi:5'-methylthioadenosine/adenosylhomocysteine nucleosidase [Bulleidia sp. zg-1006]|uniref:5'-methylthioadenosine/adenosylhomocysteine nucleosidase n=1 Tax=Bulleidia sp. zg-1006 TaxID=2806552 RepID=UPI0019394167|nr:5'-methylthioadenosine/adenosylhomocysteine nucleosidase [Bulleidia sp. zg-1006]QRG86534.1 5'-methylthioadenosine/adenosylhomocysteine nucleosidase [Bulleidia sp. zg-1006]